MKNKMRLVEEWSI